MRWQVLVEVRMLDSFQNAILEFECLWNTGAGHFETSKNWHSEEKIAFGDHLWFKAAHSFRFVLIETFIHENDGRILECVPGVYTSSWVFVYYMKFLEYTTEQLYLCICNNKSTL